MGKSKYSNLAVMFLLLKLKLLILKIKIVSFLWKFVIIKKRIAKKIALIKIHILKKYFGKEIKLYDLEEFKNNLQIQPETLSLNPKKIDKELSIYESKMGETPNLAGIKKWPKCKHCKADFNFVLQLYKKDFPSFYFPKDKDIFLLFRCPNQHCPDAHNEKNDNSMTWLYLDTSNRKDSDPVIPHPEQPEREDWEKPVKPCSFNPVLKNDYPNSPEERITLWNNTFKRFEKNYFWEESVYNEFIKLYPNWYGTKIGGYPSWTQNYYDFECSKCKKNKKLLFQFSTCYGIRFPHNETEFEDHGIEIGDAGNIYFFICEKCGTESIETYWDCE